MALTGWLLLALFASLLALLAIPVDFEFSLLRREGQQKGSAAIGWLFGAVRVPLRPRARPKSPRIQAQDRKHGGARRILAMLQTEGFVRRVLKLARDLLRHIHVRKLSLDARLGLDDPADTSRLWGAVGPLAALLTLPPAARVAIAPDFAAEVFEIECQGHLRIIPIQHLAVILVFVLSPTTLGALRSLRSQAR